jgi:quercetin 2,3-dioxygenase
MTKKNILKISKLGSRWEASDPFLFCVHHRDTYPKGNAEMGPAGPCSSKGEREICAVFRRKG